MFVLKLVILFVIPMWEKRKINIFSGGAFTHEIATTVSVSGCARDSFATHKRERERLYKRERQWMRVLERERERECVSEREREWIRDRMYERE